MAFAYTVRLRTRAWIARPTRGVLVLVHLSARRRSFQIRAPTRLTWTPEAEAYKSLPTCDLCPPALRPRSRHHLTTLSLPTSPVTTHDLPRWCLPLLPAAGHAAPSSGSSTPPLPPTHRAPRASTWRSYPPLPQQPNPRPSAPTRPTRRQSTRSTTFSGCHLPLPPSQAHATAGTTPYSRRYLWNPRKAQRTAARTATPSLHTSTRRVWSRRRTPRPPISPR